jgi:hypothetical protein
VRLKGGIALDNFVFVDGNPSPELKKHRKRHFNANCAGRLVRPCFFGRR